MNLEQAQSYQRSTERIADKMAQAAIKLSEQQGIPIEDALQIVSSAVRGATESLTDGMYRAVTGDDIPADLAARATNIDEAACSDLTKLGYSQRETASSVSRNYVAQAANARIEALGEYGGAKRPYMRFARVLSAAPCKWCIMLASNGAYYSSAEAATAASHQNCTCTVVPRLSNDALYSKSEISKISAAAHDARNARRRELYADRNSDL